MRKLFIAGLAGLFLLCGCTHIISEKSLELADPGITFGKLRENPDAYRGKFVILGGSVAEVRKGGDGVQLEVVQFPLDSTEMPEMTSESGGRFMVSLPREHASVLFRPGMVVTMAGEVAGGMTRPLKGADYVLPVIVVKEIHIIVQSAGPYRRGNYGGY